VDVDEEDDDDNDRPMVIDDSAAFKLEKLDTLVVVDESFKAVK